MTPTITTVAFHPRLVVSGPPVAIPEGEPIPNKDPGDRWASRLGEFDGQLNGRPGTPIGLWLLVEPAEWAEEEDQWKGLEPWEVRLVYATCAADKDAIESAARGCGVELPKGLPALRKTRRLVEEVLIQHGCFATATSAVVGDSAVDAAIREALVQASACLMLPGFILDRAQNLAGNSGWDFIRGRL